MKRRMVGCLKVDCRLSNSTYLALNIVSILNKSRRGYEI